MVSLQHLQWDPGPDRERRLLHPLTGFRSERVSAGQPLAVAEQGEEPVRLGVGMGVGGSLGASDTAITDWASTAPTAAACGSVYVTRGTAS